MQKKGIFILFILSLIVLSFTSAQLQTTTTNKGSNFETQCENNLCTTTVYSYDKYFQINNVWEEIDENWYLCENNLCTKNYHFNATASQDGTVTMHLGNKQFNQQISNFNNLNLTISSPTIEGSILTYRNILPDIDLKYQYLPHKLKEEIVINEPIQNLQEDFEVTFSTSGDAEFNLEYPFICDSNRKCKPVNYTISENQISLIIPVRFLNSRTTVYPVIIDPSFSLGKSSIIWNGIAYEYNDGDIIGYFRINNPSSLDIGKTPTNSTRADLDWNLDSVSKLGTVNNVTLRLFIEKITTPNFINITHIEKNSSEWSDDYMGNLNFYLDIKNGTIYSNSVFASSNSNFSHDFTFNQQGKTEISNALITTNRFSTGIDTNIAKNATISARDNVNASRRPLLIIQTKEDYNLTYDANGNMIKGFGKYLEYDAWNRLSKIRTNNATGTTIAEYLYDHEGKRILKRVYNVSGNGHNESTYYMNTRPADFIQVINTNGTIINETYIYLQDKLIAKYDTNGRKFFYHPDHLGSTSLVTNESGDVVEDLLYLPYGDVLSGTEISRFGYTGQENDLESGFMDYGARQYDARFSRFIQPDPVISDIYNPQNLNRYAYVLNNPYKYTDPTGNIVDIVADVGFIGYDIYTIIKDPSSSANYIALAADVGGAIIPGITGLGLAVRTAKAGDKALELATTADKISDGVKGVNQLENAKDAERVAQAGGDYSKFQENAQRGRASESFTLSEEGLSKNTQTFDVNVKGENIRTRPDSLGSDSRQVIEVKDRQSVAFTKQLQAQSELARQRGVTPQLITGKFTKLTQNVKNKFNIIRRGFLGPRR